MRVIYCNNLSHIQNFDDDYYESREKSLLSQLYPLKEMTYESISSIKIEKNELAVVILEDIIDISTLGFDDNELEVVKQLLTILNQNNSDTNTIVGKNEKKLSVILYEKYLTKIYSNNNKYPCVIYHKLESGNILKYVRLKLNLFLIYKPIYNIELIIRSIEKISYQWNSYSIEMTIFLSMETLKQVLECSKTAILEIIPLCGDGLLLIVVDLYGSYHTNPSSNIDAKTDNNKDTKEINFEKLLQINTISYSKLYNNINFYNFNELNAITIPNIPTISKDNQIFSTIRQVFIVFDKLSSMCQSNFTNVCLCFNGGKDCTVLLHLWVNYLKLKFGSDISWKKHIQLLTISYDDNFDEVTNFLNNTIVAYEITKVFDVDGNHGMIPALFTFKDCYPHIDIFLLGSRSTDNHCKTLKIFSPSDHNYPKLLRVHPILDWSYNDVWNYLLYFHVPYCSLYDKGYTSIGKRSLTKQNSKLFNKDTNSYMPAYLLSNKLDERINRIT